MTAQKDPHGVEPDDATRAIDDPFAELGRSLGVDTDAGWGEINTQSQALQKQRAESLRQMKAEANIFRDTFSTRAGRKCLAIMREMTLETAPYPSEAMLPIDAITPLVIAHDAQCRFVRAIEAAIAQAEDKPGKRGPVT